MFRLQDQDDSNGRKLSKMPSESRKTLFGHNSVPHRKTELSKAECASPPPQINTLGWRVLPLTRTSLTFNK